MSEDISEDTIVLIGKIDQSPTDDDFDFWEDLLADDDKDWRQEYLGLPPEQ